MKRCDECNVNVNSGLTYCPLCGSYLDKEGKGQEAYAAMEKSVMYPRLDARRDSVLDFLRKRSIWFASIAVLACFLINVIFTRESVWSVYVITAVVVIHSCVISTIYRHRRFYALIGMVAFVVPIALVVIDLAYAFDTGNFTHLGKSVAYSLPIFYTLVLVVCDVFSFANRSQYKYYLLDMWLITIVALIPFPISLIFLPFKWLTAALFIFAMVNFVVMTSLYWKQIKKELVRKFFI